MPELPEVEALAGFLRERTVGRFVVAVHVAAIGALKTVQPPLEEITGRCVTDVERHGKWVSIGLGPRGDLTATEPEEWLSFHLAKAGWLRWREEMPASTAPRSRPLGRSAGPLAVRVWFDDGSGFDLTEAGTRKRLAVHLTRDVREVEPIATLGFDPLAVDDPREQLASALGSRNQQVKGALRDQRLVAGIGNAYSDEILHAARLSPFALTGSLTDEELDRLAEATREVLRAAVASSTGRPAAELKDAKRRGMAVHGRTGQACPVCGDVVREVSFSDRSLQYCATCQTGGKPLADRRMSRLLR